MLDICFKGQKRPSPLEDIKATAMGIKRNRLKAVINLVEVSKLVDITGVLEHRVVEDCVALFNCNVTYRKKQKSKLSHIILS